MTDEKAGYDPGLVEPTRHVPDEVDDPSGAPIDDVPTAHDGPDSAETAGVDDPTVAPPAEEEAARLGDFA